MKRTKLADRKLPDYTKGEEIFNMTSHILGGALGVVATVLCVVFAAKHHNVWGIVSGAIYGFTLILLYSMSSIYHGLSPRLHAKKVFQVLDHCTIFILIAGTYTPFTLAGIMTVDPAAAWIIFGIIWGAALLGIFLNSIDIKKYSKFSLACYLIMGWCIVARADLIPKILPPAGIWLLILGGVSYTIGAVIYAIGKKSGKRYVHSIFHIFIVLGSLLQFFSILFFVM